MDFFRVFRLFRGSKKLRVRQVFMTTDCRYDTDENIREISVIRGAFLEFGCWRLEFRP
jgi:hypothetical protein